jgi:hypothetical protein
MGTLSLALRSLADAGRAESESDDNRNRRNVNVLRYGVSTTSSVK